MKYRELNPEQLKLGDFCTVKRHYGYSDRVKPKCYPAIVMGKQLYEGKEYPMFTVFYQTKRQGFEGKWLVKENEVSVGDLYKDKVYAPMDVDYGSFLIVNPKRSVRQQKYYITNAKTIKDVAPALKKVFELFNRTFRKSILSLSKWENTTLDICKQVYCVFDYEGEGRVAFRGEKGLFNSFNIPEIDSKELLRKIKGKLGLIQRNINSFFNQFSYLLDRNNSIYKLYEDRKHYTRRITYGVDVSLSDYRKDRRPEISYIHYLHKVSLKELLTKRVGSLDYSIDFSFWSNWDFISKGVRDLTNMVESYKRVRYLNKEFFQKSDKMLNPDITDLLEV